MKFKLSVDKSTFPLTGKYGFSLIELLVVISIIGVLTAVLVANFMGMRERARDAQKIQDLNSIKTALRMYYNDHQAYPYTGQNCFAYDATDPYSSSCLNTAIGSSYMPSIINLGYTYGYAVMDASAESFRLKVDLETGAGNDDTDSQVRCGVGTTIDKVFMVCTD